MNRRTGRGLAAEIGHFLRANVASTVASGLDYLTVAALVLARAHYLAAATAGAVTGAMTDFSLKRHWAFDRAVKGAVEHEGLRYFAVSGASLVLNLAVSYALVDGLRFPAVPGVIAASLLVGFVWNYPLHRCYVFRTPSGGPSVEAGARLPPQPAGGAGPSPTPSKGGR